MEMCRYANEGNDKYTGGHMLFKTSCLLALLFCLCLLLNKSYGQSCTGSLGDPIINVDFGSGQPVLSANTYSYLTDYQYSAGQIEDGYYSIKNSTVGDHPEGWWQTGDHTSTDGTGYMMVINATKQIGKTEFFRQTITGLCPGTTYEFGAWVLNLLIPLNGIKPNITFTIQTASGSKSIGTGDLSNGDPEWHQHALLFTTPPGSGTAILIMTNSAPGGGGNDIAIDDITFRACGPIITSAFATTSSLSVDACEGESLSYQLSSKAGPGYSDPVYQWQKNTSGNWVDIPGATTLSYTAVFPSAVPGTYQFRITTAERINFANSSCRSASNTLIVNVNSPPAKVIIGPNAVCEGQPISFSSTSGDTYSWTGPNGFKWNQQTVTINSAKLSDAGPYTVVVTRANCSTTITNDVTVTPKVTAQVSADAAICIGDAVQLQASGGTSYVWTPAAGLSNPNIANPIASPASDTKYTVKVIGANDCFDTAPVMVSVTQRPVATAGKDIIIYEGQSVTLDGAAVGKTHFWTPSTSLSSDTALHAIASPTEDITYTLHSVSGAPCNFDATDQVFIRVYQKVIIPNTFTPNNDGVNDTWNVKALSTYPTADTQIFDRQGFKVFQTTGYAKPWDGTFAGKPLPAAAYYYKIDLKNGQIMSGWVTVLR